eukprot:SAG31_NODE_1265_length_9070_cov_5.167205_2_plen_344_part_00
MTVEATRVHRLRDGKCGVECQPQRAISHIHGMCKHAAPDPPAPPCCFVIRCLEAYNCVGSTLGTCDGVVTDDDPCRSVHAVMRPIPPGVVIQQCPPTVDGEWRCSVNRAVVEGIARTVRDKCLVWREPRPIPPKISAHQQLGEHPPRRLGVRVVHPNAEVQPRAPGWQPPRAELIDLVAALTLQDFLPCLPCAYATPGGGFGDHSRDPPRLQLDGFAEVVRAHEDHVAVHCGVKDNVRQTVVRHEPRYVGALQSLCRAEAGAVAAVHRLQVFSAIEEARVGAAVVAEAADHFVALGRGGSRVRIDVQCPSRRVAADDSDVRILRQWCGGASKGCERAVREQVV